MLKVMWNSESVLGLQNHKQCDYTIYTAVIPGPTFYKTNLHETKNTLMGSGCHTEASISSSKISFKWRLSRFK